MPTLLILNPHAAGGRAGQVFQQVEGQLLATLGEFVVAVTQTPDELEQHLDSAAASGIDRIIAVGGDGTNHAVLNALAARPDLDFTFGSLPVGTGRDWARFLGVPADPAEAVAWLGRATPAACDLGRVAYTRPDGQPVSQIFLNIASAGVSGEVAHRVNVARRRTSVTFLRASIVTLLRTQPQPIGVVCDGSHLLRGPQPPGRGGQRPVFRPRHVGGAGGPLSTMACSTCWCWRACRGCN